MIHFTLALVFAAAATLVFLWALIPILRANLLDLPNQRSSHCQPTPRGGGVVIVIVASVASSLALSVSHGSTSGPSALVGASLFCLPLALVGFLDDYFNLPASFRFGVQLFTAFLVTMACPLLGKSLSLLPLFIFAVIAVTGLINFINFMDGLDGLVSGCMAVAITAAAIQLSAPWPIWSLVGALIGFLFWNWNPAKVFMGDVGSTYLGAMYGFLVLQASSWSHAFSLLLVATPLLADSCTCLLRRLLSSQPVFKPHRLHLYQRMFQAGWSHASVSTLYIAATALLAIALLWGGLAWVITLASLQLLVGIFLDQLVAVPFAVESSSSSQV